jgi:hypothetical protein
VANHKKTAKPRKPQHHLPKVGTPANNAYRTKESRRDVVDFGVNRGRGGAATWVIAAIVIFLLVVGVIGFIALT